MLTTNNYACTCTINTGFIAHYFLLFVSLPAWLEKSRKCYTNSIYNNSANFATQPPLQQVCVPPVSLTCSYCIFFSFVCCCFLEYIQLDNSIENTFSPIKFSACFTFEFACKGATTGRNRYLRSCLANMVTSLFLLS